MPHELVDVDGPASLGIVPRKERVHVRLAHMDIEPVPHHCVEFGLGDRVCLGRDTLWGWRDRAPGGIYVKKNCMTLQVIDRRA